MNTSHLFKVVTYRTYKTPFICDLIGDEQDLADTRGPVPLLEMSPTRFKVWHQPRPQGKGRRVAVDIWESLLAFRGHTSQVSRYEMLFLKLG